MGVDEQRTGFGGNAGAGEDEHSRFVGQQPIDASNVLVGHGLMGGHETFDEWLGKVGGTVTGAKERRERGHIVACKFASRMYGWWAGRMVGVQLIRVARYSWYLFMQQLTAAGWAAVCDIEFGSSVVIWLF